VSLDHRSGSRDACHAVVEELSPTPAPGSGSGSTSRRRPARREDGRAAATGGG
jgi:hypothetical protein